MSFLLDALRKSEDQKRLGSVPTIHSADGLGATQFRRWKPGIAMLLLTPAALVVAWFAWHYFTTEEDSGRYANRQIPAQKEFQQGSEFKTDSVENPVQRSPLPAIPRHASVNERVTATRTPVERFSTPDNQAGGVAQSGGAQTGIPSASSNHQVNEPMEQQDPLQQPAESVAQEAAVVAVPETSTAASEQNRDDYRPTRLPEINYWSLPESVREEVTRPKMSVLVFSARPEDRFVLIEGKRFVEKDELQPGMILEEIRRDGAVFSYRHYRFLVDR